MHGRVNPSDGPKINPNCHNGFSGQNGKFFPKKIVASERSDGLYGQFCAILLADKSAHYRRIAKIVPRSHEECIANNRSKCLLFLLKQKLDNITAIPKYKHTESTRYDYAEQWSLRELRFCSNALYSF